MGYQSQSSVWVFPSPVALRSIRSPHAHLTPSFLLPSTHTSEQASSASSSGFRAPVPCTLSSAVSNRLMQASWRSWVFLCLQLVGITKVAQDPPLCKGLAYENSKTYWTARQGWLSAYGNPQNWTLWAWIWSCKFRVTFLGGHGRLHSPQRGVVRLYIVPVPLVIG